MAFLVVTKYPARSSERESFGSTIQEDAIHSAVERVVGRGGGAAGHMVRKQKSRQEVGQGSKASAIAPVTHCPPVRLGS